MRIKKGLYLLIDNGGNIIVQGNPNDYVIQVHRNVYWSKVAGRVWNYYLTKKLIKELGFCQSNIDGCVLYKGRTIFLLYNYDSILVGTDQNEINDIIKYIKKENIDITVEGDIQDFLGINTEKNIDGTITLSKPHLINQIFKYLRLDEEKQ